jgi:hypothetical protein
MLGCSLVFLLLISFSLVCLLAWQIFSTGALG